MRAPTSPPEGGEAEDALLRDLMGIEAELSAAEITAWQTTVGSRRWAALGDHLRHGNPHRVQRRHDARLPIDSVSTGHQLTGGLASKDVVPTPSGQTIGGIRLTTAELRHPHGPLEPGDRRSKPIVQACFVEAVLLTHVRDAGVDLLAIRASSPSAGIRAAHRSPSGSLPSTLTTRPGTGVSPSQVSRRAP